MLRVAAGLATGIAALVLSGNALGAQLIDRNATGVLLEVSTKDGGEAMLVYHAGGKLKHVLVWGATNARIPSRFQQQVKFKVDYSGGWGKYRTLYWKHFVNQCRKYDGPALPNVVTECKSPDGTYWAVQQWPQALPDLGFAPWTSAQNAMWMEISHWTGPIASLTVNSDWVYSGRFQELFGQYTYAGQPVFGFGTTNVGAPTDNYGRLIYLDTYNSAYGPGWRRENSFVPHNPTGVWCYGFYTFDPTKGGYVHPPGETAMRGPGLGEKYRLIASGPGVTPNIEADIPGFHAFNPNNPADVSYQQDQNTLLQSLGDKSCMAGHH